MGYYCKNSIICHIYELYGAEPFMFGALSAAAAMVGVGIYLVIGKEPHGVTNDTVDWLGVLTVIAFAFFVGTIFGVVITQSVAASSHASISDDNNVVIPPRPPIPPCNLQFEGCFYSLADELRDIITQHEHILGIGLGDQSYADRHNVDEDIIVEFDCNGDGFIDAGGRAGDLTPQPCKGDAV